MIQAEEILNSRPITSVSSEPSRILRPADFLNPTIYVDKKENPKELRRIDFTEQAAGLVERMEKVEQCVNELWQIWQREYLQYLRERSAPQTDLRKYREPKVDEIVLLRDDNIPKYKWRLARVMELIRNKQGRVSSAVVRVSRDTISGKGNKDKIHYCTRPVEYLYRLEEPEELEENDPARTRADQNLEEEEPEVVNMGIETNKEEIPDIPKNNIKKGLWWTTL